MEALFAAVDLAGIVTFAGVAGLAIIGYNLTFKGVDVSKRAINKA